MFAEVAEARTSERAVNSQLAKPHPSPSRFGAWRGAEPENAAQAPSSSTPVDVITRPSIAVLPFGLAGHETEARTWAQHVRERNPRLSREDFFRAFPIKSETMYTRVSAALRGLGF